MPDISYKRLGLQTWNSNPNIKTTLLGQEYNDDKAILENSNLKNGNKNIVFFFFLFPPVFSATKQELDGHLMERIRTCPACERNDQQHSYLYRTWALWWWNGISRNGKEGIFSLLMTPFSLWGLKNGKEGISMYAAFRVLLFGFNQVSSAKHWTKRDLKYWNALGKLFFFFEKNYIDLI